MNIDWSSLRAELAQWHNSGLVLPIWWRDDDAIKPTSELDHLIALSRRIEVPVHLAIVPKFTGLPLADHLANTPEVIPVVHGWAHQNHAPKDSKKAEFGADRTDARQDMTNGIEKLRTLFGTRLAPMFVPPWNRIDLDLFPDLQSTGYTMISAFKPRPMAQPIPGLIQINTHIDPIDWRGTRGLVNPAQLITQIVQLLQDRREGTADNSEPLGFLTHHLVHTADVWDFTAQFFNVIKTGPTTVFCANPEISELI